MGLQVQVGHLDMRCTNPEAGHSDFIVVHTNGLHRVAVNFCGCEHKVPRRLQLLRQNWYPSTVHWPQTCSTLEVIQQYHVFTLAGKMTGYEYYVGLERLTDNTKMDVPNVCFGLFFYRNLVVLSSFKIYLCRLASKSSCAPFVNSDIPKRTREGGEETSKGGSSPLSLVSSLSCAQHAHIQESTYHLIGIPHRMNSSES